MSLSRAHHASPTTQHQHFHMRCHLFSLDFVGTKFILNVLLEKWFNHYVRILLFIGGLCNSTAYVFARVHFRIEFPPDLQFSSKLNNQYYDKMCILLTVRHEWLLHVINLYGGKKWLPPKTNEVVWFMFLCFAWARGRIMIPFSHFWIKESLTI